MKKILLFILGIVFSGIAIASVVNITPKNTGQELSANEFNQVLDVVNNLYNSSGNIGVGTEPTSGVKLDVDGVFKIKPVDAVGSCANEGEIAFNKSSKHLSSCVGGSWLQLDNDPCITDCSCASDTCEHSTCSDGCGGLCNGTKTDGVCATIGCGATTTVTDTQGNSYSIVTIGQQCWMQENLNLGTQISGAIDQTDNGTIEKYCYDNVEANCTTSGGLYEWNEAMGYLATEGAQGICPNGWHIPTDSEWKTLEGVLGMTTTAQNTTGWRGTDQGDRLKVANKCTGGENCNASEFTALLGGYKNRNGDVFQGTGMDSYFWSSTVATSTTTWSRYLSSSYPTVYRFNDNNGAGFSVRCVKGEGAGGTTCTDTCESLGYECGDHAICLSDVNCGTCGDGQTCNASGKCETAVTPPADCTATTISNCVLPRTASSTSVNGSCATGYTGSCAFDCYDGTWTQANNTCVVSCTSDCSCASSTCQGSTCSDGCGGFCNGILRSINGGWSEWSEWSCSGDQSSGEVAQSFWKKLMANLFAINEIPQPVESISRTRSCTNPVPQCGGLDCSGEAIEIINCAVGEICENGACVDGETTGGSTTPPPIE